jgi:formylglycine-generating enzyme required for sulfatase activity
MLNIGENFAGYQILREIGKGGMGVVYLAKQLSLGRDVALKLFLPSSKLDGDPHASQRFTQEALLLAKLAHRNILPIFDVGIANNWPWMALQYVPGENLSERMKKRALGLLEGLTIFRSIAIAVDFAHRNKVIHRDLKPSNVLLSEDGQVYLADFGIAQSLDDSGFKTVSGMPLGTPAYMAPEQAKAEKPITAKADIYALGVMCFEWLTGVRPFIAADIVGLIYKVVYEPPPEAQLTLIGPELAEVFRRALAKTPAERNFANANALIDAFEAVLWHWPGRALATVSAMTAASPAIEIAPIRLEVTARQPAPFQALPREDLPHEDLPHEVWPPLRLRDQYGEYADLVIQGETQRMRWIASGEFFMGSPNTEAQREGDEGPQHLVRLSHGFWLADSACTQAFWLALLGNNPSHFKGNLAFPVENVSWNDVQQFLHRLQTNLPQGCTAGLPTEAQWEYACRSGTITPFSFGENITPEQVNYDGDQPYNGNRKGQFRARTVAVKSLAPNAWGLYEMHGNVWEWCADGLRNYRSLPLGQAEFDPVGAGVAKRALRGGSWINVAAYARAASRDATVPEKREKFIGLRLLLNS